jgi:hypothetical protein
MSPYSVGTPLPPWHWIAASIGTDEPVGVDPDVVEEEGELPLGKGHRYRQRSRGQAGGVGVDDEQPVMDEGQGDLAQVSLGGEAVHEHPVGDFGCDPGHSGSDGGQ